jgi:hypothetical protein
MGEAMAVRSVKKVNRQKNKGQSSPAEVSMTPSHSGKPDTGLPFWKLLAIIGVILAFIYGPSLFKGGVAGIQPEAKYFLVKKVAQFTGDQTQGKPFFANDIVAVNSQQLAITDNLNGQVLIYDFKGKLIRKWGKNGSGPREFREPSGITTDGKGHLYVLDTMNSEIKTFDPAGSLIHSLKLNNNAYFSTPRRIGWGGNTILVVNTADARLARLSPAGELASPWGEKGAGKGGLWGASKPIWDGKDHFYMGDLNMKDSLVRVYDGSGKVIQEIKTGVPSDALALDSKGRLFVGSYGEPAKVFDPNGNWLGYLADEAESTVLLNQITGIDVLSNGFILTCGGNVITIYKLIDEKEKQS